MSQYVTLLGAEDVARAGHNMSSAAEKMNQAASSIETSVFRLEQAIERLEIRLVDSLEKMESYLKDDTTP